MLEPANIAVIEIEGTPSNEPYFYSIEFNRKDAGNIVYDLDDDRYLNEERAYKESYRKRLMIVQNEDYPVTVKIAQDAGFSQGVKIEQVDRFEDAVEEATSRTKDIRYDFNEMQASAKVDGSGNSQIEKSVIGWRIDSDPQGARVFFRVISSNPDIINTNDLYLGATPFSQTRVLDIMGLSEDNAGNVEIEIRLSKKGYMDQTKRLNVRNVLAQKEISNFFELVEED